MRHWLYAFVLCWCFAATAGSADYAKHLADLITPAKLATLGPRGANPRIQKAVSQLEAARTSGLKIKNVAADAVAIAGYRNAAAKLTVDALWRNHDIAVKLGCLNAAGLEEMRRGKSPTVTKGPYKGQELSVDHIIPRAVVPELDNVIANLELLPLKLNQKKNDTVGDRQLSHAKKLYDAGLLSAEGLKKVQSAGSGRVHSRAGCETPANFSSSRILYRTAPHRWTGFSRPSFTSFRIVNRETDNSLAAIAWFTANGTNVWLGLGFPSITAMTC